MDETRINLIVEQLAGRITELTIQLASANAEMTLLHQELSELKEDCMRENETEDEDDG